MLVLTRNIDQTIIIVDDIKITVLDVNSSQAKLRFEAPAEVKIMREELLGEG